MNPGHFTGYTPFEGTGSEPSRGLRDRRTTYGIYVGNIDIWVSEEELRTLFSAAGNIVRLQMMGPSAGTHHYAFLDYATSAEQQRAIKMFSGHMLGSRNLKIGESRFSGEKSKATPGTEGMHTPEATFSSSPHSVYGSRSEATPIERSSYLTRNVSAPVDDVVTRNWTDFDTQLLSELSLQQYYAALELEHAKLVLRQRRKENKT